MNIQDIKLLTLNFLFENSPEEYTPSILDLGYLKESFGLKVDFNKAFEELVNEGMIDNPNKGWADVFYASISDKGRKFVKKMIDEGQMLKSQILTFLLENQSQRKLTNSSDLQNIFNTLIKKYSYTGPGIFVELKEMIDSNILGIDNTELDNKSNIFIKRI